MVNGIYSFHASASAYREYWNNSFKADKSFVLSCHHVWQAFVQKSTQTIAASAQINLELNDDEVIREAFNILGENGLIRAADQHSCIQCTQKYKATSDINNNTDPASVAGVDENQAVPPIVQTNSEFSSSKFVQRENLETDIVENEPAPVKMVVLDGIVIGPQHCAFDNCTADLANTRGGVFCLVHDIHTIRSKVQSIWLSFSKSDWNTSMSLAQSRMVKI